MPQDSRTKRRLVALFSGWLILLFFALPLQGTALAEQHEQSAPLPSPSPSPPPPSPPPASDEATIRALVEELYEHYEAVDRELGDLHDALHGGPVLVPFTISIKKESSADREGFSLISVEVKLDGESLWTHRYTDGENKGLDGGGRHEFYKGSAKIGPHRMLITCQYVSGESGVEKSKELKWELLVGEEPHYMEVLFMESEEGFSAEPRQLDMIEPQGNGQEGH